MFNPTLEQSSIFTAITTGESNLLISAVAGSGKTTTLIEALKLIPRVRPGEFLSQAITFLAFNKDIATELQRRCPAHVSCSTFHSLGLRALKNAGLNPKVEPRKVAKLLLSKLHASDPDFQNVLKLVSFAKQKFDLTRTPNLVAMADHNDLDIVDSAKTFRVAEEVLWKSLEDTTTIDFDDMLWMPVMLDAPFSKQDWVFVDEAQDTNDIQLEILERLAKFTKGADWPAESREPGVGNRSPTRYVFVGDPNQAIYGFRGANADSLDHIRSRFSCIELPLSFSRRCPKAVVAEARKYLTAPL